MTDSRSFDGVIRYSTAAVVVGVAGVAAYVSYQHAFEVVRAHGEGPATARVVPLTVDGLVYASSMVLLHCARHRLPVPGLARALLAVGIAATLFANVAHGLGHGAVGAVVAAWPAVALVGAYELLMRLVRSHADHGDPPPHRPGRPDSDADGSTNSGHRSPGTAPDGGQRLPGWPHAADSGQPLSGRHARPDTAAGPVRGQQRVSGQRRTPDGQPAPDTGGRTPPDRRVSGQRARPATGRGADTAGRRKPARRGPAPDETDLDAAALRLLMDDPEVSGAELGRQLGIGERRARRMRDRLSGQSPPPAPDSRKRAADGSTRPDAGQAGTAPGGPDAGQADASGGQHTSPDGDTAPDTGQADAGQADTAGERSASPDGDDPPDSVGRSADTGQRTASAIPASGRQVSGNRPDIRGEA